MRWVSLVFLAACGTSTRTVVTERTVIVDEPGANQIVDFGDEDLPDDPTAPVQIDAVSGSQVPVLGGGLLQREDGTLIVADAEGGRLFVTRFSMTERSIVHEIDLGAGSMPFRMDSGFQRVWVTLRETGEVVAVDPVTGTVDHRIDVCPAPRGVAIDGADVWVACATGELVHVDADTATVVQTVFLQPDLRDVVVDGPLLAVSRFRAAEILWVNPKDGAIVQRSRPADDRRETFEDRTETFEPAVAWRMQALPEGGGVVVAHQRALAGSIPEVIGENQQEPRYGDASGCTSLTHSVISWADRGGDTWSTFAIDDPLPVDVRFVGDELYTLSAGSNELYNATLFQDDAGCDTRGEVSPGTGIAVAFAFTPAGRVTLTRAPLALNLLGRDPLVLAPEADDVTGFSRFHKDASFGVSCASCHPEGHDDGRVWNFRTRGPRRTQTLAVGLANLDHLHWDGEFDSMDTLLGDVLVERMSGGSIEMGPAEPKAIVDFLDRTPALRGSSRNDAVVARGAELFWSDAVGCAECHHGPAYSDGRLVDVGTGIPARTPSLLGVGQREVWMHDGCATTLHERFGPCGGGDLHGRTSHLSDEDVDAMVAYLETL